jgi:hypothetical protein
VWSGCGRRRIGGEQSNRRCYGDSESETVEHESSLPRGVPFAEPAAEVF